MNTRARFIRSALTEEGGGFTGLEGLRDAVLLLPESEFVVTLELDFANSTVKKDWDGVQAQSERYSSQVGSTEIEGEEGAAMRGSQPHVAHRDAW